MVNFVLFFAILWLYMTKSNNFIIIYNYNLCIVEIKLWIFCVILLGFLVKICYFSLRFFVVGKLRQTLVVAVKNKKNCKILAKIKNKTIEIFDNNLKN